MRSKSSWASRLLPQTTADLDDSENPNPRSPTFPTTAIVLISRALLLIIVASYFYTLISWNLSASPVSLPSLARSAINGIDLDLVKIDWSRFAYAQYVTTPAYLCNSVMIFESLHRLGARADKLMMYPHQWDVSPENDNFESRMLRKARDEYGVGLAPIEVLRSEDPESTWAECFTKLLVFNQTQYDRLIHLDSDATVRQPMDELFLLPPVPMVTPRAYWLAPRTLSSQFMVVRPSSTEFDRLMSIITTHDANQFDMDIVNNLYGNNGIIIPHRPYDLLSGEFRADTHAAYLGSDEEVWDPISALKEAKFLHFSDWPYPKPWIEARTQMTDELKPRCHWHGNPEREDCRNQEVWVELYTDFARRREDICGTPYA